MHGGAYTGRNENMAIHHLNEKNLPHRLSGSGSTK